jgi:hypothetical protein
MDCEDDLSRSAGDSPIQEDLRIDDQQDLGDGSANNESNLGLYFVLSITQNGSIILLSSQ